MSWSRAGRRSFAPLTPWSTYSTTRQPRASTYRRSSSNWTLRRTLRGYLDEWHATIRGNVTEARGLLSVVLRERITFTPKADAGGAALYELRIPIAFDRILVSLVPGLEAGFARVGLASPTGFEPVFWP